MTKNTQEKLKIYLDSCAFISYFNGGQEAERSAMMLKVIEEAKKGTILIYTSQAAIAECPLSDQPIRLSKRGKDIIEAFFDQKFINKVQVDRNVAFLSRNIQQQSKMLPLPTLKPMDAIHAATARLLEVDYLFTYDNHLVRYSSHILAGHIKIHEPFVCWTDQTSMEDVADFSTD